MKNDDELYNELIKLRDTIKHKEHYYTNRTPLVCPDESIKGMIKYRPVAPDDFLAIEGIGPVFVTKYAEAFLKILGKDGNQEPAVQMPEAIKKTLKELEKNLVTLNKRNRLLYTGLLRAKDGVDLFASDSDAPLSFLFGKKQKLVFKNDPSDAASQSVYTQLTRIIRETNRDQKDRGLSTLYIGFPFIQGKMYNSDLNIRAPLAFFPVTAEKKALQITIKEDDSRDIIFNNTLVLASFKFHNTKRPLPNEVIDKKIKKADEFFTLLENFYRENDIVITIPEDSAPGAFVPYKSDEFPEYAGGEFHLVQNMVLGRYVICDNSIQKDFDALIEEEKSTLQLNNLLTSFSDQEPESQPVVNPEPEAAVLDENSISYINNLNDSQENVLYNLNTLDQLVIQGPPGTGKSQTITSIISNAVLQDKTVLLVSEKKTALDVVYSRLGELSKFALLIDDVENKKEFYRQVSDMLNAALDSHKRNRNVQEKADEINGQFEKLQSVENLFYRTTVHDDYPFRMYQKSEKMDLQDETTATVLIAVKNMQKELLEQSTPLLDKSYQLFTDEEFSNRVFAYHELQKQYPHVDDFKDGLSEIDLAQVRAVLSGTRAQSAEIQSLPVVKRFFAGMKLRGQVKKQIKPLVQKHLGKLSAGIVTAPDIISETLDQYTGYQESKSAFLNMTPDTLTYFNGMVFIRKNGCNLSPLELNWFLYNALLNIRLMEYETGKGEALKTMEDFAPLVETISKAMKAKKDKTVNNCSVTLSRHLENLVDTKRKAEILRGLNTNTRTSVTRFISKFKYELFKSVKIWMLTPEVVSEIIPLQQGLFDLVIFDEASQLFVEKGIPAIYRAKKVVIAGDTKQLRPMKLFSGRFGDEPDEAVDQIEDETNEALEEPSLLDLAQYKYKDVLLNYHYRSRYEELIAFSNYAFYQGRLMVSPNAEKPDASPIEVHKIDDGIWEKTANRQEAVYCVKLLKEILKTRKHNESIGIITFNSHQHDLIEDMIDKECDTDLAFENMILAERNRIENGEDTSLFVKNIENVQGDERDIIIFSIGFAKNSEGKLYRNFGWLNAEHGENRLNVAISRAKQKIHIITSIEPRELNVNGLKHEGPSYLKKYLEYAFAVSDGDEDEARKVLLSMCSKDDVLDRDSSDTDIGFEDDQGRDGSSFIASVAAHLEEQGYDVVRNVGIGGYTLDLAIRKKNRFVLGIECDESLYTAEASIRERDYHRQKFLESKGWNVYRLWSPLWWKDKEKILNEIRKLV